MEIKGTKILSMTNDKYKMIYETALKDRINDIKKFYSNSISEAGRYYVR